MRLIEKRSHENTQAFSLLYAQGLFGASASIIRQEIDNLMRVDYLAFSIPLPDRDRLCSDFFSGARWQKPSPKKGKLMAIRDVEFHTYAKKNHGWISLAYEASSNFVHLTNFWHYEMSDPLAAMPANDIAEIVFYLGEYHGFTGPDLTMKILLEYLPQVFEKIRSNVEGYVDQENGMLLDPLPS